MTTDPKTTAAAAAKQNTLAHRPAAQGTLNKQPTIRPGSSSSTARPGSSSSTARPGSSSSTARPGSSSSTARPGSSSSTARPAASSSAQAGQGTKSAPVQPVKANIVNTTKKTVLPAKNVAPPPTLPNPLPEGFKLWKPIKFLNTTPAANKP